MYTIVQQFDIERQVPAGIDTCIQGIVRHQYLLSGSLQILGSTTNSEHSLGDPLTTSPAEVDFVPVVNLDHSNQVRAIPHSVRLMAGVARYAASKLRASDAIQAHRLEVGVACHALAPKVPSIQFLHPDGVTSNQTGSDSFWRFAPWAYGSIEKLLKRAERVVVFNPDGASRLQEAGVNAVFAPTWYDENTYYGPREPRGSGRTALWVGRIESQKDPLLALEVLSSLSPDWRLMVVGSGSMTGQMARAVHEMNLSSRVEFVGPVPRTMVAELMRSADVLLMTSHYEGVPRVMMEALACGLPVAATQESDTINVLPSDCVAMDRNPASLRSCVEKAVGRSSKECSDSVNQYSEAKVLEAIYGSLV